MDTGNAQDEPEPAPASKPDVPAADLDALQHDIRVASRNGRYALIVAVLAAVAALLSSGVSAWASMHVSSVQLDRQENLAHEQTIRTDRLRVYSDFLATYTEYVLLLGGLRAALEVQPTNFGELSDALADVTDKIIPYYRGLTAVLMVGSPMDSEIDALRSAQMALWQGPGSLEAMFEYIGSHDVRTDPNWPSVAASGVAAIDKFVSDPAIDKFVEHARNDLGSG